MTNTTNEQKPGRDVGEEGRAAGCGEGPGSARVSSGGGTGALPKPIGPPTFCPTCTILFS